MEHKSLMQDIEILIGNELENARNRFSNINSSHEGYAVILEEFEELQEEVNNFQQNLQSLWKAVKSNENSAQSESIKLMEDLSKHVIKESIQLSAMCRRFNEDVLNK
jgi:hypothetical protein